MFHREGYTLIGITILLSIVLNFLSYTFMGSPWLHGLILVVSLALCVFMLLFFRNPDRHIKALDNQVLAPVDGKIVALEKVFEKEYFKEERLKISVFMSMLNVHVTRHPVNGIINYTRYHPGKYLVAWHPKSSEKNEHTTVVVENPALGEVLFRQIAGAVARRIVNYSEVGAKVIQGNDSGFIKFGSRVDVLLPLNSKTEVKLNQKVRGGETVIAKHPG